MLSVANVWSASSFCSSASASLTLPARMPKSRLYLNPITGPTAAWYRGSITYGFSSRSRFVAYARSPRRPTKKSG